MSCSNHGFVRVKLLGCSELTVKNGVDGDVIEVNSNSNFYVAVKIKEAEKTASGVILVQKRRTMNQDWGTFFDSHLWDGRVVHMLIMDRRTGQSEGEISIGIHLLAGHCKATGEQPVDRMLGLNPRGQIKVQLRYFNQNSAPPPTQHISELTHLNDTPIEISHNVVDEDNDEDALYGIAVRRHAVKQQKIFEVRGHKFIETFFKTPTFCSFCSEFLWGLSNQGFKCQACNCTVHKRCHEKILSQCPGNPRNSAETKMLTERFNLNVPHRFAAHTFLSPAFCDHCGSLILVRGGVQCQECRVSCHKKCHGNMPNLCGVNQKILSELLDTVRASGVSRESNQPKPPASKSQQSDDEEDEYACVYEILSNHTSKIVLEDNSRFPAVSPAVPSPPCTGDQRTSRPRMSVMISSEYVNRPAVPARPSVSKPQHKKHTMDDFNLLKVLGKGSFGKVFLGELKDTNTFFAIKALKKDVVLEDNDIDCTMLEKKVLEMGSECPYLTYLHSAFQTESHLFFVMEYLNGGDLMFHIQKEKKFSHERALFYAAEMICGLQFLHLRGIIYRDLKPDNVLLDKDGHIKLADFGMCKEYITGTRKTNTFCGTPHYLAPEIIKFQPYNSSVDWFSFGIVLFEMLAGRLPFDGFDEDEMFHKIVNTQPKYPRHLKPDAISCIHLLLVKNPNQRLGMPDCPAGAIREHVFFKSIDWTLLEQRKIEPPVKPKIKSGPDASNFDQEFTREPARLTNIGKHLVKTIDQSAFDGFSFTNPRPHLTATIATKHH